MNKKTSATDRFWKTSARVSEVPRGILSSLGFCTLAVIGRQVGPDGVYFHSGVESTVFGYNAKFQPIFIFLICFNFNIYMYKFFNLYYFLYTEMRRVSILGSSIRINDCWGIRVNVPVLMCTVDGFVESIDCPQARIIHVIRARSKEEAICRRGPHNIVTQEGNYRLRIIFLEDHNMFL
ncbi:hypothetical protein V1477_015356 [Vespula maculifrons]|uniref:Uncharacterized protein n=1 Tax=Vespula maculifrons TaxID=7453 RepID=A0ABD2BFL7_VESMC